MIGSLAGMGAVVYSRDGGYSGTAGLMRPGCACGSSSAYGCVCGTSRTGPGRTTYGEPITAAAAGIIAGSIAAASAITTTVIAGAQKKRERSEARMMLQRQADIAAQQAREAEATAVRMIGQQRNAFVITPVLLLAVIGIPVLAFLVSRLRRRRAA